MGALTVELKRYEDNYEAWLEDHEGRWVLIHGTDEARFFVYEVTALRAGYDSFGNVAFLVRQVLLEQPVYTVGTIAKRIGPKK